MWLMTQFHVVICILNKLTRLLGILNSTQNSNSLLTEYDVRVMNWGEGEGTCPTTIWKMSKSQNYSFLENQNHLIICHKAGL